MLTYQEKNHIKDILGDGLRINREINFPYFLDAIDETNKNVKALKSQLDTILFNQRVLDNQLKQITNLLAKTLANYEKQK